MKLSRGTLTWLGLGFIWCIFMGITAISIGVGALYPPLNLIAKPFVCPRGDMIYETSVSNPLPGTTYTIIGWYCVDRQTEASTPLDIFQIAVPAGTIYGLGLVVVALIVALYMRYLNANAPAKPTVAARPTRPRRQPPPPAAPPGDSLARMKELNRLRSAKLITAAEYQQKRDEILKGL